MTSVPLAEAGFVSVGKGDAVKCVGCNLQIWKFVEKVDPLAIHQAHALNICPFLSELKLDFLASTLLHAAGSSAAVPQDISVVTTSQASSEQDQLSLARLEGMSLSEKYAMFQTSKGQREIDEISHQLDKLELPENDTRFEVNRQRTFVNSSLIPDAVGRQLSAAGMYLNSSGRSIACQFCNFVYSIYSHQDLTAAEVVTKHNTTHSFCHLKDGNVPQVLEAYCWNIAENPKDKTDETHSNLQLLGVTVDLSKYPEFAVESRREATFLTYPYKACKMPDDLVKHGYFYEGKEDSVTCFSCGIVSSKWTREETVPQRHARSSRTCQFLILLMGAEAIQRVVDEYGVYETPAPENKINTVTTRMYRPRWDSNAVQRALEMGIKRDHLRAVVGNRIKRGDQDFVYVSEIAREVAALKVSDVSDHVFSSPTLPEFTPPTMESTENSETEDSIANQGANQGAIQGEQEMEEIPGTDSMEIDLATDAISKEQSEDLLEPTPKNLRSISQQLTCKICLSNIVGIIFLPCGHLVCCTDCAAAMIQCPVCRRDIRGTVTVNYAAISRVSAVVTVPPSSVTPKVELSTTSFRRPNRRQAGFARAASGHPSSSDISPAGRYSITTKDITSAEPVPYFGC